MRYALGALALVSAPSCSPAGSIRGDMSIGDNIFAGGIVGNGKIGVVWSEAPGW